MTECNITSLDYRVRLEILKSKGSRVRTWDDLRREMEKKYGGTINYTVLNRALNRRTNGERAEELRRMADEILTELEEKEEDE